MHISPKSLFFHWLHHYWKCCLFCHMPINQKAEVRNTLFSGRGLRWEAFLCWTTMWVIPTPKKTTLWKEKADGVSSLPPMRPGGRPVLGQAPGLLSKPRLLGQCSVLPQVPLPLGCPSSPPLGRQLSDPQGQPRQSPHFTRVPVLGQPHCLSAPNTTINPQG